MWQIRRGSSRFNKANFLYSVSNMIRKSETHTAPPLCHVNTTLYPHVLRLLSDETLYIRTSWWNKIQREDSEPAHVSLSPDLDITALNPLFVRQNPLLPDRYTTEQNSGVGWSRLKFFTTSTPSFTQPNPARTRLIFHLHLWRDDQRSHVYACAHASEYLSCKRALRCVCV